LGNAFPDALRRVDRLLNNRGANPQALEAQRIRLVHRDVNLGGLSAVELGLDVSINAAGQAADAIRAVSADGPFPDDVSFPEVR